MIDLEHLSRSFGPLRAVDGVSLRRSDAGQLQHDPDPATGDHAGARADIQYGRGSDAKQTDPLGQLFSNPPLQMG